METLPTIEITLSRNCAAELASAMVVFAEIAKDYPNDDRFQIVTDMVMHAISLSDN